MPILVTCPGCQKSLAVPDNMAGTSARCKGCGTTCHVPAASAPVAIPVLPATSWYLKHGDTIVCLCAALALLANLGVLLLYLPALLQPRGAVGDFLFMALCLHGTAVVGTVAGLTVALTVLDMARALRRRP